MKNGTSFERQKGQSFVELSVLFIVLVILLAGVTDFGKAYMIFLEMRDAAQEGAAYGAFAPTDFTGIETRIRETMKDPLDLSDPDVVKIIPVLSNPSKPCSAFDSATSQPNEIKVTLLHQMQITTPFLGTFIGTQEIPLVVTVSNTILTPTCE
jgi:Flp pilus assembly protein TadG